MNNTNNSGVFDDDWNYDLSIWISVDKSPGQFERSLSEIIDPIQIKNRNNRGQTKPNPD